MKNEALEDKLVIGSKIRIGNEYAAKHGWSGKRIRTLVQGYFEHDNGLYTETQTAPSLKHKTKYGIEYDSIYHLFGNDLEHFMDCEIVFDKAAYDIEYDDWKTGEIDRYFNP